MDAYIAAADRHCRLSRQFEQGTSHASACVTEVACRFCMQLVSFALEVPLRDIQGSSRGVADVALARQIAMYLAHTKLSILQVDVGTHFGRDKSTVTHACRLVESKRDDASFDDMVAKLEAMIDAMQTVSGHVAHYAARHSRDTLEPVLGMGEGRR